MAGQTTGLQKTYKIEDATGILRYRGATRGANAGGVIKPTAIGQPLVGVTSNDARDPNALSAGGDQSGRDIALQIDGIGSIELTGTVVYGDKLVLDIGGTAIKLPATTGSYNVIGIAEVGGVAGDVIAFTIGSEVVVTIP